MKLNELTFGAIFTEIAPTYQVSENQGTQRTTDVVVIDFITRSLHLMPINKQVLEVVSENNNE